MKSLRAGLLLLQVIAAAVAVSRFLPAPFGRESITWVLAVTVFMAADYPFLEELMK